MLEAKKDRYFIDGFLIRHFNVYPENFDKENLFAEQKIFLIYLMGVIPSLENWMLHVDYLIKMGEIQNLDTIELSPESTDLSRLRGQSITEIKRQNLIEEKKRRIKELNKKFHIEEQDETIDKMADMKPVSPDNDPQRLWNILQGKGIIK